MTASGIDLVCEQSNARRPFDAGTPFYVLFEASAHRDTERSLLEILSDADNLITDAVTEGAPAHKLRLLRESYRMDRTRIPHSPCEIGRRTPARIDERFRTRTRGHTRR